MASVQFYGLRNCDTCKKALKALDEAGVAVNVTDVRGEGVPGDQLRDWLAQLGAEALVNKRSTTWRGLTQDQQAGAMDPAAALTLLKENPTLMKRPVIQSGENLSVGWNADILTRLTGTAA